MAEMSIDYQDKLRLVRAILMAEWDPIGVRDEPAAQDEYDKYLPTLIGMLEHEATPGEIAQFLSHVSTMEMGLIDVEARDEAAAQKLVQLGFA